MKTKHRQALLAAISGARAHMQTGDYDAAMPLLERAHVLGQSSMGAHALVHGLMLRQALGRRALGDAAGQLARIVLGVVGNAIGVLPTGNTGGSDVSMFRRLPIPADLSRIMESDHD